MESAIALLPVLFTGNKLPSAAQPLCSECSIRHKENRAVLPTRPYSLYIARRCSPFERVPDLRSSIFPDGVTALNLQSQAPRLFRPQPVPRDGPLREAAGYAALALRPSRTACRQNALHLVSLVSKPFCHPSVFLLISKYEATVKRALMNLHFESFRRMFLTLDSFL